MKNFLFIFLSLFLALAFPVSNYALAEDDDPIILDDGSTPPGGPVFHAPHYLPINASFNSSTSTINLDCFTDLGFVTVSIVDDDGGEIIYETEFTGTMGVHYLPVIGCSGTYELIISLSDGREYSGCFKIE